MTNRKNNATPNRKIIRGKNKRDYQVHIPGATDHGNANQHHNLNPHPVTQNNATLEIRFQRKRLVCRVDPNPGLAVLPYTLFEEVSFALKGNHLHPVERVCRVVLLLAPKLHEQSVGAEFDILSHESAVHAYQLHWQRGCDEFLKVGRWKTWERMRKWERGQYFGP